MLESVQSWRAPVRRRPAPLARLALRQGAARRRLGRQLHAAADTLEGPERAPEGALVGAARVPLIAVVVPEMLVGALPVAKGEPCRDLDALRRLLRGRLDEPLGVAHVAMAETAAEGDNAALPVAAGRLRDRQARC